MGEIQGNLWASLVFMISFGAIFALIAFALGFMDYTSKVKVIEDSISTGNYSYYKELPSKFNVCTTEPADTESNCTGLVEINENEGYVKYQVSYNSLNYKKSAAGSDDYIVLLPY